MTVKTDFSFFEIAPDITGISLVDVGAAPTKKAAFYQPMLDSGRATVIGFEPDPASFQRLQERSAPQQRNYPYFIGSGEPATYHQTTFGFTGSLYPANTELVEHFSNLSQFMKPAFSEPVTTHRLDDVLTDATVDFMKLDVQGGELGVLRGAPRLLPTALLLEIEVEFVPLYKDQPLFADVDTHMRQAGFQLHMFSPFGKTFYTPVNDPKAPLSGLNQVLHADAVYIPVFESIAGLPRERVLKLVAMLHDFYKSWDLCLHLLQGAREDTLFAAYLQRLELS